MAICDAHYVFTFMDIGSYGSNNESERFRKSTMGKSFFNKKIDLPHPDVIDECPSLGGVPYFLVGDEVFPLHPWLLHPYPRHELRARKSLRAH